MVELVPASPAHIGTIANRMREIDRRECEAMGRRPKQALRAGISQSDMCWTAMVDSRPEAMFGRVVESALTGDATVWFLGTDEVYRHPREMIRWGKFIVRNMGDSRLCLRNLVSVENGRAIRLLRHWGFEVSEGVVTIRGVAFHRFEGRF